MRENPIVAFARDFSNQDETLVAAVRGYVADTPTDEKIIGFYGSANYAVGSLLGSPGLFLYAAGRTDKCGYPPGTRMRAPVLPFAE